MTSTKPTTLEVPSRLALAEKVLGLMKGAAQGTEVWEDSAVNTGQFPEENHDAFLHKHWQAARRAPADSTFFFVARQAEPNYLTLRTFSRLGYLAMLPRLARALEGLPVDLDEDRSWTWDHENLTPAGRPTYRRAYVLSVLLKSELPFKSERWLKKAAQDVCDSVDERTDQCVFQMRENAKLPSELVTAYETTKAGWVVDCADAKAAQKVAGALFSDCKVEFKPVKGKGEKQVQLVVALP
jgi:hypothetical protein